MTIRLVISLFITKDERFRCGPLVTSDPFFKFYAGAPLITPQGHRVGTICVLDYKPKTLTESQKYGLQVLSRQVVNQMELKLQNQKLQEANREKNKFLGM